MEKICKELTEQQNIRGNLSNLRQLIRNDAEKEKLQRTVAENDTMWLGFLHSEDAKTRKNAALLLGDLAYQPAEAVLWDAYLKEQTLFVKSAYLTALDAMDVQNLLPDFRDRMQELLAETPSLEEKKHIEEEIRALRRILIRYDGIARHTFVMPKEECEILLTTNRLHREVVKRSLEGMKTKIHPLGVMVKTDRIDELLKLRTYRELLFAIATDGFLPRDAAAAAQMLMDGNLLQLIEKLHKEDSEFYFRVECKSNMDLEARSRYTRKLSTELEHLSGGKMINSTTDYEIEIRLVENREGNFFPCLKCCTLKDTRFSYRKNAIAASIHPSTAALMMELARPYLKENAQIMDPFCGVGTMLIERHKAVPAREMYATDIFGEAVEKGRENASYAGVRINFIHRDFFDFKHDYLFDEIVTNMPVRGKRTKEEMDRLYARFFCKVLEILAREAVIVMYTNEMGFVKKQLRLHKEFTLLQETCMQSKSESYLLIIGVKR